MTKEDLLKENKVRSKTMKVTFKAFEVEKAMQPDMWPFRLGVRYFKAESRRPSREGGSMSWKEQSAQSGGRVPEGRDRRPSTGSGHLQNAPPGSNEWSRNRRNRYQNIGGWNVLNNQVLTAEGLQQLLSQFLPGP